MAKEFTEEQVLADLRRKSDIRVTGKQIQELKREKSKGDVGIKTKGKIDFLCGHHSYTHIFVTEFK
jgi:hypothetical protein